MRRRPGYDRGVVEAGDVLASDAEREAAVARLRQEVAVFVTVNAVCIAVWLATGANGGFWPGWVLLVSGIGLVALVVRAAFGVEPPAESRRTLRRERARVRRTRR